MCSAQLNVVLEYNKETCSVAELVAMMSWSYLIMNVMIDINRQVNRIALQSSVLDCGLLALLEK